MKTLWYYLKLFFTSLFKKKEKIYPIYYKGKWWNEEDCDDVFTAFYYTEAALGENCSVYVSDGMRVCPDGEYIDEYIDQ